uniref:Intraflagellar transport protein 56 n=1 Tax=Phaeocystis antarctica TaxID=33657 RepID=A0A7S0HW77_9EUKA|mmetsp:Transcript_71193/g.171888  ORF Transcript_71193/g.171888 Transcript_71193/m.171888 type:complete len:588 (-) Transcript_71193:184-1947(-)
MQAARQQGGHLRGKKNDNVKKVPELAGLLEARDYTGAVTLLEFERKMFIDQKQASGWKDKGGGADSYEWVEGGNIPLTEEEKEADHTRLMWIGYCAFHLGDYRKALDTYQQIIQAGSDDQTLLSYQSCCLMGLGWFQEAEEKANQGPASPLQTRLLFHLAHRLNDENKLMMFHQKLCDTTSDQLSLASIHYLRNHFQEATDIYKRLLLENRDYTALNVYVALCYYKLDYYDVSLEILAAYLQVHPDSSIALNLKACNQFRLYDGKAAEAELAPLTKDAVSIDKIESALVRHNMVVFQQGERALQILPPIVGTVPEARLNLVIYHMHHGEVQEAYELMREIEPTSPQEYILKGITNLALGQQLDSREHLKVAQQYFQLLGASASECDTIPGRQCMASCFFVLRQFDDVLVYLSSIEAYYPNDPAFLYNYAVARAAAGKYKEAEPALLSLQSGGSSEELSRDYIFQMWLARCLVMNGKARHAWELYLKMEGTQESFAMLQLLANDCYRAGAFLYAAKAFDTLERLDPNPEYWEGKRGACVGTFQQIIARKERKEVLRDVLAMLKSTRNPQVEYLARVMKKWARENGINA